MSTNWKSPQSIIITVLILIIFSYMIVDAAFSKPRLEKEVKEVKNKYIELSTYLDKKIPEIDSTFKIHASEIKQQKAEMDTLKSELTNNIN